MIKPPYTKWINDIKTKLGFSRTMTASGEDVVDAVNKQSQQISKLQETDAAFESGLAVIVDGDTASQEVPVNGYAYIKNNTHGLADGLYKNTGNSSFPMSGGMADYNFFTSTTNALNSNIVYHERFTVTIQTDIFQPINTHKDGYTVIAVTLGFAFGYYGFIRNDSGSIDGQLYVKVQNFGNTPVTAYLNVVYLKNS